MINPWGYLYEKSKSVQYTLKVFYKNLRWRLSATVSGGLIPLLNLENYPTNEDITNKVQEILDLMPEKDWKNRIIWLHYTKIKKITEKLIELDYLIGTVYWEYKNNLK